jgi:hypothetical protein
VPGESPSEERLQGPQNVISLRGHQEAEQALDNFLSAPPGRGYYTAALSRALGVGAPIVAAAARRLDATKPDALLRLGDLLARFPSRNKVVQTLSRAAEDRRAKGKRRLGALMVLEGLHVDGEGREEDLYSISDAAEVLAESLLSVSGACGESLERCAELSGFFRFLLGQPPDLLYAALGTLTAHGGDEARTALRVLSVHPHPDLADAAVEAIALDESPGAAHDLAVLARTLPPEGARLADRHLRKRLLSGTLPERSVGPKREGRALLSAIDGAGKRLLWLRWPVAGRKGKEATLLVVLSDTVGVVTASATRQIFGVRFPPQPEEPLRPFVWRPFENGTGLTTSAFVEVTLEYALRLVSAAAKLNWASGTPLPLEYVLSMSAVWEASGVDPSQPAEEDLVSGDEDVPEVENESDLLANPLFEGWYIDSHGVRLVARDVRAIGTPANALTHDNWRILLPALIRLAHDEFGPELRSLYARRLRLMSEWFRAGGLEDEANCSASAARTMQNSPPEANLFVLRLLQRGVLMALGDWN